MTKTPNKTLNKTTNRKASGPNSGGGGSPIPVRLSTARDFPAVELILQSSSVAAYYGRLARPLVASIVKDVVASAKAKVQGGKELTGQSVRRLIDRALRAASRRRIGRIINATGIVVHTNLGRAPLSDELFEHIQRTVTGYGNVEFDVPSGKRGRRGELCELLLAELSGAEAGTVVNNCAAGLLVTSNSLANRREILISRGELVQIGGGFRIPDILKRAGARLREVGTTNITSVEDYAAAITGRSAMILKVHKSNFIQAGFTEEAPLATLAALGRKHHIPVVNDLGSGVFVNTQELLGYHEPTVQESVRAGAALTLFSGDKMLGGGQAGLIVGQAELVKKVKKNPLFRAVRVDKIVYSMLEKLLTIYLNGTHTGDIKLWRLLATPVEVLQQRAEALLEEIGRPTGVSVEASEALVGGGALPEQPLPSAAIAFTTPHNAQKLLGAFRDLELPVIGRIEDERFVLDLKTVDEPDLAALATAITTVIGPAGA